MRYPRLYSDAAGDSRFDEVEVEMAPVDFAPPAPPMDMTAPVDARNFRFLQVPPGWTGGAHPSPRRQFGIVLGGRMEVTGAPGESRVFEAGDVFLMEDTTGTGHATRALGDDDLRMAITAIE